MIAYCKLYLRHCNPNYESDRSLKKLKHDLNGDAMDLDSVQKKTVSMVSDRCYVYFQSPWFPRLHDDFCHFWWNSFLSILSPDTWQAINWKLGKFGGFLSLCGKYKQAWDFGSNNGSLVRILKSLVNQGCVVKRGTTKVPAPDSNSVLFITCGIQENGGNA